MVLDLHFSPQTEAKLQERAKETGKAVESIVSEAVEEKLAAGSNPSNAVELTPQQKARVWSDWVAGMARWASQNLPAGQIVDDSRESIYSGRGE
ncbi:MAG TPA: hypothetical protein VHX86_00795 [Tepidisphaeraceae bacterium]|jgi:hypothetical protein|nr:hypothetical protein [Tepidisphaeraceae bacterium]